MAITAAAPRRILLTGTLAIDYVGEYPGTFSRLPKHEGINLSVQLARIERRFGGCAMNIAYTLKALGEEPTPFVFVGLDFDRDYARHLDAHRIDVSGVNLVEAPYSSHGFIFTDRDQNQFTGFFGGPAAHHDLAGPLGQFVADRHGSNRGFEHALLAPDLPSNMIAAAETMRTAGIPFLTDPGQNLTDFDADGARELVALSRAIVVNEYEHDTLLELVGEALDDVDLLLVTEGERGTRWVSRTGVSGRERAVTANVVDSTGCGDAFRAGYLHASLRGADIRTAVRAGGVTAALVLETRGTQNHGCRDFAARYRLAWGDDPPWPA